MSLAAIAQCWTFVSSKGSRRYQTLLYTDGSTSCDCPGWCKRVAADGSRSCRHTRSVLLGAANGECESTYQYQPGTARQTTTTQPNVTTAAFGQLGRRKIHT
jgi:hypothetical protein